MTQAMVLEEAKAAGVSVNDILKRRIWLGPSGEGLHVTCDVEQAAELNRSESQATSRSRRAQRTHQMLYSMRVFAKQGEKWDVGFWRPQDVSLWGDTRFPLQGCMQPVDSTSWLRYNQLRDGPPQLTVAKQPPGLPFMTPHKAMPRGSVLRSLGLCPAASGARSSTEDWVLPGALPKAKASPFFLLQVQSKWGCPPVNPVTDQNAPDDGVPDSPRSPTPPVPPAITWLPPDGGARSRSRTPRRPRSPRTEASAPAITWSPPDGGLRSRSRSPRRPRSVMPGADEELTEARSCSISSREL